MLLADTRRLCVAWRGGIAPFELRLVSASGQVPVELFEIHRTPIRMPEESLQPGVYSLQISDVGANDELTLSAVPEEHLPDTAREILAVDIPGTFAGVTLRDFCLRRMPGALKRCSWHTSMISGSS